ncbi:alpha-ketoglutarate dependent xanthine dioxygenase [Coprinopsis sp. MPI-PUGE-AT-0042]|nr:alpha-ketoglutarate dependent xanthine dioxygenase [Coprinopsis sp. MPI-PUGE-AT-0042]
MDRPRSPPPTASADATKFNNFGREVKGVNPENLTEEESKSISDSLYKKLDAASESYNRGNNKTIPSIPQVQLIGNGTVHDHWGLAEAKLKHPSHKTFHKTVVSQEDEDKGVTRFYRWHIDTALYDLNPPRVTTLYGLTVPQGNPQVVRYDDGTSDELPVPFSTTAFVSGTTMFDILPKEYQSFAVRTKVKYAPHPYVWMAPAHAISTGLGIESEGLDLPLEELPAQEEFPRSKSSLCSERTPSPANCTSKSTLVAHKNSSSPLSPLLPQKKTLSTPTVHTSKSSKRAFHQCNLAASDEPVGPSEEDVKDFA